MTVCHFSNNTQRSCPRSCLQISPGVVISSQRRIRSLLPGSRTPPAFMAIRITSSCGILFFSTSIRDRDKPSLLAALVVPFSYHSALEDLHHCSQKSHNTPSSPPPRAATISGKLPLVKYGEKIDRIAVENPASREYPLRGVTGSIRDFYTLSLQTASQADLPRR